jgi:uncharacterized membrane protein
MAKTKYILFGIGFFILAIIVIRLSEPQPPLLTITQTSGGKRPYLYEGIVNGVLAVQEVTPQKDYLNGLQIRFATMGRENTCLNALVIFDSSFNPVYDEKFSAKDIQDTKYHDFRFRESKKVGKGNKLYICLLSKDGDSANSIHGLFNASSKLGNLYACAMVNNDLVLSVRNKVRLYPGALMLRTYESDHSLNSTAKTFLYFVAFLIALVISFFKKIRQFLIRTRIRPELVYVVLALIFGLLFTFLTPPGQVPDGGSHMARAVELSEYQFSGNKRSIPSSFFTLDSAFIRMHFSPDEKTTIDDIRSMAKVKLNPEKRHPSSGPNYIVPYLPQLIGLWVGKLFSSTPLILLYFGRFFNLLVAILLIFFAIRITPVAKWTLLLLALMPKTLFIMASMSYDAFVIGCSFLLIAMFLYYAFKYGKTLGWKDIGLLFFLSMLLAFCKPPYFILGLLFLIIPVTKIGSWLKYLLVFSVFVVSMLLAQGMWSLVTGLMKSANAVKTGQVVSEKPKIMAPATQVLVSEKAAAPKPAPAISDSIKKNSPPKPQEQKKAGPEINSGKQLNYIKANFTRFLGLLVATNFVQMRSDMLNNFVGTMGWLDTFLPDQLVNLYLLLLLIAALCIAEENITIGWRRKLFFFFLLVTGIVAIETAMYLYSTVVANPKLFGIQGRYFIPLAPLFLLIFYNNFIPGKLNYFFSTRRKTYLKAKSILKPKIMVEILQEQMFTKYLQVFIIGFAVVTLIRGIAAVLLRYYQW